MKMKLLMQWDIRSGHNGQYLEFVVREFAPTIVRMGLEIVDAWYTQYGDKPQILIASVAPSEQELRQVLASQEWEDLLDKLFEYVHNFQTKVVPDHGRFQF